MKKGSAFETNADIYEEWFIKNNYIFDSEIEAIKYLIPASGEGIEIGAGTGIFSSRLGIKHGIEPSEKMRSKALERGIDVISAFAEEIPIADETYHFALMVTVDCFLEDVLQAFKEVWRILSKDGFFIIAFIDRETPLGMIYNQNKQYDNFYKYANFHSSEEIIKLLERIGFEIQEKKQTIYTLENIIQEVKDNVGNGVFAVIKAKKV
ncbi:class I SAM-dependent methyltransferase [Dehalobacterium formicoaceticum]|uniref:class I SAM-dependent methyltransferase n=1 Tax=Dehalobacterium formicoaceticum TaxID=51515 RepID=UPI0031F63F10